MALVTVPRLRAVYTLLRHFTPFDRWLLPEPSMIRFELLSGSDHAEYRIDMKDRMCIGVNPETHLSLQQVIESVAHEMCHLRQDINSRLPIEAEKHHNAEFRRLARVVCRNLGFDIQRF